MSEQNFERVLARAKDLLLVDDSSSLPPISSHRAGDGTLNVGFEVTGDLMWFRGHFPGKPIVPGVVQLHWAVGFSRAYYGIDHSPQQILRLKFKKIIVPPASIELTLTRVAETDVRFGFTRNDDQFSLGLLRFAEVSP